MNQPNLRSARGTPRHVAGARRKRPGSMAPAPRSLDPGEAAWIAAVPCALVTFAAAALLGAPLGHAFLGPGAERFWAIVQPQPEPVEHGRFVIALVGPALLGAAAATSGRWRWQLPPTTVRGLVFTGQATLFTCLLLFLAAQNSILLSADSPNWDPTRFFTPATLVAAAALAVLPFVALRKRKTAARLAHALRETRPRRLAGLAIAALLTVAWLLTMVNFDSSVGNTNPAVTGHILWSMDETFAILNGRTPLVSFHAQYGQLWPYLAALTLAVLGTSIGVYTIFMASVSGLALLAIYATLRRVVRNSAVALALYLPFLATGFFMKVGPANDRYGPESLFSLWPIRYGGAYLLAWLTARHVDNAAPRRSWAVFLLAGLVVLNNPEFGLPAFGATLVALGCAHPPRSRGALARLLAGAAIGLAAATLLVALLTLARSGQLPRFGLLLEFSRLYGIGGWGMIPMPAVGLHLIVFATFAAALVVAAVRAATRAEDALLTAMLAWSGVFGLGVASYYVGRSHPQVLIDLFSAWSLSLVLLLVLVVRSLAARAWRRPTLPELAVLFGFGLAVCSVAQIPTPWSQIARLGNRTPTPVFKQAEAVALVRATAARGEHVAIVTALSHRVAYDAGVVNIAPFSSIESMPTQQQLTQLTDQMRREHVRKLYLSSQFTFPEELQEIDRRGFKPIRQAGSFVLLTARGVAPARRQRR